MHPQPPRRTTHTAGSPKNLLVYDRWGDVGRPVVLLHGLLFDRTMWWPVAAAVTNCTVVAPDLPGHGQSPARDDYQLPTMARDLAVLVNGLGLHRAPVVVGHAAAARLATTFADAYAVHCLITIDEPPEDARSVEELTTTAGLPDVPEIYRPYAQPTDDPALLRAYASWLAQPPTRHNQPAMAGGNRSRTRPAGRFSHLTDPDGFAAQLQGLL